MRNDVSVVHYWGGEPNVRTSRFDWHQAILDGCRRRGWRSTIVFSTDPQNEELMSALGESGIQCLYAERPKRQFDLRCILESYRAFKKTKCTIAHFHCVHTSPIIGAALARVPIRIWSNHSATYRDDGKSLTGVHRYGISTRVTCALAHKVLPVSDNIRKELLEYGVKPDRMCVACVPIDVKRYEASSHTRKTMRASLGYANHEIVVCSVGQAIYRKGWDILVRAFAEAVELVPQLRLLLVGAIATSETGDPNAFQKDLLRLVGDLGIRDRVRFLGVRDDVGNVLSASDLFAFPSRAEGLPLALMEAMAAGLACTASSVSGIPELIQDGDNGFLVEKENVAAFSAALVKLAKDEKLRMQLGERASGSLEKFSLEYQVAHILALYEELLEQRGRVSGQP